LISTDEKAEAVKGSFTLERSRAERISKDHNKATAVTTKLCFRYSFICQGSSKGPFRSSSHATEHGIATLHKVLICFTEHTLKRAENQNATASISYKGHLARISGSLRKYDCYLKIFLKIFIFQTLELIGFLKFSVFYIEQFKSFISLF